MKHAYLSFLLYILCWAAPMMGWSAEPWGITVATAEDTTFSTYAVDNLIDKRPIRYAVSKEVTPQEEAIFKANILKWPAETLHYIEESGREQEFQDIVPILRHPLTLIKVSKEDSPNIMLVFSDKLEPSCVGDFRTPNKKRPFSQVVINPKHRDDFALSTLHELGHYFGLGDQYEGGRINSHEEYSSNVNHQEKSIMQVIDSNIPGLTCDDADGLVNLIDLRLSQRTGKTASTRTSKGWKSLCPKSENVYQNARTITRGPDVYAMDTEESWSVLMKREYEQGRLTRRVEAYLDNPLQVFSVTPQDQVTRDPKTNRITKVITRMQGEVVFPEKDDGISVNLIWEKRFSYQAATQRNEQKVIPVQITELIDGVKLRDREVLIAADGSLQNMALRLTTKDFAVKTSFEEIGFSLQNQQITRFGVFDDEESVRIAGIPDQFVLLSIDGGVNYTRYNLPLDKRAPRKLAQYFDVYQVHRNYLMSFYQNFYEPLFGTNAARTEHAQQTRNQVKKQLTPTAN
ncbi:MAG: hypothetical protein IKP96_04040 [Elusimicrobiaceae bacterium]|nr:hypothetical protein [Elusimicrobiaceae bacterium]